MLNSMEQEYDIFNTQSLEEAVRHSDMVFNLVGRNYPTKYVHEKFSEYDSQEKYFLINTQELHPRGRSRRGCRADRRSCGQV